MKIVPTTNALAFCCSFSDKERKKVFIALTPGLRHISVLRRADFREKEFPLLVSCQTLFWLTRSSRWRLQAVQLWPLSPAVLDWQLILTCLTFFEPSCRHPCWSFLCPLSCRFQCFSLDNFLSSLSGFRLLSDQSHLLHLFVRQTVWQNLKSQERCRPFCQAVEKVIKIIYLISNSLCYIKVLSAQYNVFKFGWHLTTVEHPYHSSSLGQDPKLLTTDKINK